jgi:2-dehydro-3-deoxygalactonokinase
MQATAPEAAPNDDAFARGVADAGELAMSHALFSVRARVVTGALAPAAASALVSGLLIGAEWQDVKHRLGDGPVRIVGEPALARLHVRCAEQLGLATEVFDVRAVQLAAWQALREGME